MVRNKVIFLEIKSLQDIKYIYLHIFPAVEFLEKSQQINHIIINLITVSLFYF